MIYVFLANGFEEVEAIAAIDVLRRAELAVTTVAIGTETRTVTGAHGIPVLADQMEADVLQEAVDAVVLPGGMPGTLNLEHSQVVQSCIQYCLQKGKLVAAICAAPSILGHSGCLEGKQAICYPGFEAELTGALVQRGAGVVRDGNLITARGPGVAIAFGLEIVKAIVGANAAEQIGMGMQCPKR